ncbi:HNH endonuclease signature motif containing protein (plasmid) [Burkholderia ambifaria]
MNHPSQDRVRELFEYDSEKGVLTWRKSAGRKKAGDFAGNRHLYGYIVIGVDGRSYGAHQIVWLYVTGEWPKLIDHINGIRDDNRFTNLRHADAATNARNRALDSATNKLLGAYLLPNGKYRAAITVDGDAVHLGTFETEVQAHMAYSYARALIDQAERVARAGAVHRLRQANLCGIDLSKKEAA